MMIGRIIAVSRSRHSSSAQSRRRTRKQSSGRFCHSQAKPSYHSSPVTSIRIGAHHNIHVKRDDLLGEPGTGGNKARKLAGFHDLLKSSQSSQNPVRTIVSTGGTQSNAMLSTAHFAKEYNLDFHFFSPPVSAKARSEPHGNLATALALGMKLHESQRPEEALEAFRLASEGSGMLFVPRGVSGPLAEIGLKLLAEEIDAHFQTIRTQKTQSVLVVLPSGTGTTATFLNRHLQALSKRGQIYQAKTVGVSVALKPEDLKSEIEAQHPNEPTGYPTFTHPSKKRIPFARPDPHVKAVWCAVKRRGLLLDLIYGPVAWMSLFEMLPSIDPESCEVYYVHTGGITGNDTQLHRYATLEASLKPKLSATRPQTCTL